MEKGIPISELLQSDVFKLDFDYDEWPQTHTNYDKIIQPYNGSMFQLIDKYDQTFGEELAKDKYRVTGKKKMYKMKYTLNILPMIGEYLQDGKLEREGIKLMELCYDSEELEIFDQQLIMDIIEFKWNSYARQWHYFGAFMHFFYMFTVIIYVNKVYIDNAGGQEENNIFTLLLAFGIIYSAIYDTSQMIREGTEYWNDIWNYTDFIYIWSSMLNIGL